MNNPPLAGHSIFEALPPPRPKGSTSSRGASPTPPKPPSLPALNPSRFGALKKHTRNEQLVDRLQYRLDQIQRYLDTDENWAQKLEKASLRDIAIVEGVWIDKLQALTGNPTQIISVQQHEKIDQILPVLMQMIQQRGLKVTATQNKLEVQG